MAEWLTAGAYEEVPSTAKHLRTGLKGNPVAATTMLMLVAAQANTTLLREYYQRAYKALTGHLLGPFYFKRVKDALAENPAVSDPSGETESSEVVPRAIPCTDGSLGSMLVDLRASYERLRADVQAQRDDTVQNTNKAADAILARFNQLSDRVSDIEAQITKLDLRKTGSTPQSDENSAFVARHTTLVELLSLGYAITISPRS